MSRLDLNIRLVRGSFTLAVSESLPAEGLTAVFGPSGAGKSTLLRVIAGFERTGGRIAFDGDIWEDGRRFVPPHRRRVATVFQDARLFPHLDVAGNLAYAARRAGQKPSITDVVARLDLGPLLGRRSTDLSGGEVQRVALARALLTSPRLILMDEPLSALDAARRGEILPYIETLREETRVPILYVSHRVSEVARLATQIAVLSGGRITRIGPAVEVLADAAFADEAEPGSLIAARITGLGHDGLTTLRFAGGNLLSPERLGVLGSQVLLHVRARDVMIATTRPEGLSALNILPARVAGIGAESGASVDVTLMLGTTPLHARITRRSVETLGLRPGTECHAVIKSVALLRD